MGFFDGADPSGDLGAGDLERIAAGGIPHDSELRLAGLSGPGSLFTSTLSANEFALLEELKVVPIGQLLGASVHQVGWQYLPQSARLTFRGVAVELSTVSQAWEQARRRAFARLTEEARLVGADAVVVTGTGIRIPGSSGGSPVLSDLSGQEYWKLAGIGWAPAGLVAATCVYFVAQSSGTRFRRRLRFAQNQELEEFSQGFHDARQTVVRYLRGQAQAAGASGIVGVTLQHAIKRDSFKVMPGIGGQTYAYRSIPASNAIYGGSAQQAGADERKGIVITVHAVGTAIRRVAPTPPPTPRTTIRLGAPMTHGAPA
jgi:uncharacterized protein YbjQ (UPF0145 family)